ncbi:MAG: preprotein translocase subunit SecG [Spirochaetia bacterium]|nr:preprotein translocase subunit SecG [Spirochaetota bacterium]MCX8095909.1 preprotein translocase subunit SecG [Spirochaetota bacterium]MDW8112255.1 preprotein translocase subunit SecG [Spirochaetia bacterium]
MVLITILSVLFVINSILLIIVVLLQSRGGAEIGIFGGSNLMNPFGSRAGDVLSNITRVLGISFMVLAFLISFAISKSTIKTPIQKPQSVEQLPQQPTGTPQQPLESPQQLPQQTPTTQ